MKLRPDFFKKRWLRASPNTSLNDPFENKLSNEYLIDMIINLSGFEANTREEAKYILQDNYKKEAVNNAEYAIFSNHGVMSFTETRDNLLMWSHYADEHKGVVVEFDPNHEFFTLTYLNECNSHEGRLCRVLYRKERLAKVENYLMDMFVHKSDEWSYEKEHRMVLTLAKANKKLILQENKNFVEQYFHEQSQDLKNLDNFWELNQDCKFYNHPEFLSKNDIFCMYEIPKEAIKSITFGCNCEDSLIEESQMILAEYTNIKIQKVRLDDIDYRLRFDDL